MTNALNLSKDYIMSQPLETRLEIYEAQRQIRGTKQVLARVAQPVIIKDIKGGARSAYIRLAINQKGQETEFKTMSQYIAPEKVDGAFEHFLANLEVGQLVSVEYKENKGWNNIYNIMVRDNKKAQANKPETNKQEADPLDELPFDPETDLPF